MLLVYEMKFQKLSYSLAHKDKEQWRKMVFLVYSDCWPQEELGQKYMLLCALREKRVKKCTQITSQWRKTKLRILVTHKKTMTPHRGWEPSPHKGMMDDAADGWQLQ